MKGSKSICSSFLSILSTFTSNAAAAGVGSVPWYFYVFLRKNSGLLYDKGNMHNLFQVNLLKVIDWAVANLTGISKMMQL